MALINCKECFQKISSKAKNCPHCGCPRKDKSFYTGCFFVFLGLLTALIVFLYILGSRDSGGNVISDERNYSKSWRLPNGNELIEIGRIIIKNEIKVCGEYHLKEINTKEFVIACSADGTTWDYFVVYTSNQKIYRANEEMESKLIPPR